MFSKGWRIFKNSKLVGIALLIFCNTKSHSEANNAKVTEVLGENLPQRHFVYHKSHMTRPGIEPGLPWWEVSD
jgi:hypothetical protein